MRACGHRSGRFFKEQSTLTAFGACLLFYYGRFALETPFLKVVIAVMQLLSLLEHAWVREALDWCRTFVVFGHLSWSHPCSHKLHWHQMRFYHRLLQCYVQFNIFIRLCVAYVNLYSTHCSVAFITAYFMVLLLLLSPCNCGSIARGRGERGNSGN